MTREDFVKLIGADKDNSDYIPIAFLLRSGYACSGNYNAALNKGFTDLCIMLNLQLIEIRTETSHGKPVIADFSDFLEEVIVAATTGKKLKKKKSLGEGFGKTVPIAAIPLDEIAVIYPMSQIETIMRRAEEGEAPASSFLDMGQSEILAVLRTKLW